MPAPMRTIMLLEFRINSQRGCCEVDRVGDGAVGEIVDDVDDDDDDDDEEEDIGRRGFSMGQQYCIVGFTAWSFSLYSLSSVEAQSRLVRGW